MTFRLPIYAAAAALLLAAQPMSAAMAGNLNYSAEEAKQDTSELLTSLKEFSVEQKEQAVDAAEDALHEVDDRIDALQARVEDGWHDMSEQARDSARDTLNALRERRQDVAEWLGGLKNSTGEVWVDVKQGFSEAYQYMSEAWDKAERELGT
jgi:hypothetical protein